MGSPFNAFFLIFSLLLFKEKTYVVRLRNRGCLIIFMSNNVEKIGSVGRNCPRTSKHILVFLFNTADWKDSSKLLVYCQRRLNCKKIRPFTKNICPSVCMTSYIIKILKKNVTVYQGDWKKWFHNQISSLLYCYFERKPDEINKIKLN